MGSAETFTSSYDTGKNPYKHDDSRGKWRNNMDFYWSSVGYFFGLKHICLVPLCWQYAGGIYFILIYVLILLIGIIPIYFIKSALGQFSSSGFLSIYRISPFFKGIAYIVLFLNIFSAAYESILTSYSLIYFLISFSPVLPWTNCYNPWNTGNCINNLAGNSSVLLLGTFNEEISSPTMDFLRNKILQMKHRGQGEITFGTLVLPLVGCSAVIWIIVGLTIMKGVHSVGRIIRYSVTISILCFVIILIRTAFLPSAWKHFNIFNTGFNLYMVILIGPYTAFKSLGSGWGILSTLSSYNSFKTDIVKYSFAIPFSMFGLTIISACIMYIISGYIYDTTGVFVHVSGEHILEWPFIIFAYFATQIEASHLWCILYYLALFLCELNTVIILTFSIITSLFDEYVQLRRYKMEMTVATCGGLFLISNLFATQHGHFFLTYADITATVIQMCICSVEVIIIAWIYGRIRFQRDISFMLGCRIATWTFYIIKFITIFLLIFATFTFSILDHKIIFASWQLIVNRILDCSIALVVLFFGFRTVHSGIGSFKERFRKSFAPTDWYPAAANHRREYEYNFGTTDISHQMLEMDLQDDDI